MEWKRHLIFKPFWFTWITFIALILWIPTGFIVPEHWGWENGPIENFQFVFLFFGIYASCRASRTYRDDKKLSAWWAWSVGAWLLIIGRELTWGRSLFWLQKTPLGEDPDFYSKEEFWIGPYINPIVLTVLCVVLCGLAWNFSWKKLKATVRIPVFDVISFFVCFLGFTLFEHHFGIVPDSYDPRMEEIGEAIAYWNLACIVSLNSFRMPEMEKKSEDSEDPDAANAG